MRGIGVADGHTTDCPSNAGCHLWMEATSAGTASGGRASRRSATPIWMLATRTLTSATRSLARNRRRSHRLLGQSSSRLRSRHPHHLLRSTEVLIIMMHHPTIGDPMVSIYCFPVLFIFLVVFAFPSSFLLSLCNCLFLDARC